MWRCSDPETKAKARFVCSEGFPEVHFEGGYGLPGHRGTKQSLLCSVVYRCSQTYDGLTRIFPLYDDAAVMRNQLNFALVPG